MTEQIEQTNHKKGDEVEEGEVESRGGEAGERKCEIRPKSVGKR